MRRALGSQWRWATVTEERMMRGKNPVRDRGDSEENRHTSLRQGCRMHMLHRMRMLQEAPGEAREHAVRQTRSEADTCAERIRRKADGAVGLPPGALPRKATKARSARRSFAPQHCTWQILLPRVSDLGLNGDTDPRQNAFLLMRQKITAIQRVGSSARLCLVNVHTKGTSSSSVMQICLSTIS